MELLRDRSEELRALGVQPYGISRDSPWTHVAWTQALDLAFPLLSDWNGDAARGFGVAFEYRGLRDVSARSAFLVDTAGVVRAAWRYETSELPDFEEILTETRAALPPSG
jgi:peroxiredoxin